MITGSSDGLFPRGKRKFELSIGEPVQSTGCNWIPFKLIADVIETQSHDVEKRTLMASTSYNAVLPQLCDSYQTS